MAKDQAARDKLIEEHKQKASAENEKERNEKIRREAEIEAKRQIQEEAAKDKLSQPS